MGGIPNPKLLHFKGFPQQKLRIYTTAIPTEHRLYTPMHDPRHRLSLAWQNVAYHQPPHTSFYLGNDMAPPPVLPSRCHPHGERVPSAAKEK